VVSRIAGGKRDDARTATLVVGHESGLDRHESGYFEEDLYRTAKGNWFAVTNTTDETDAIRPLSTDEAIDGLEQRGEVYEPIR
jgi:hypothetical protein